MFKQLTLHDTREKITINVYQIVSLRRIPGVTILRMANGDSVWVKETEEEIIQGAEK